MTGILFLAVVVLFILLMDLRSRFTRFERQVRSELSRRQSSEWSAPPEAEADPAPVQFAQPATPPVAEPDNEPAPSDADQPRDDLLRQVIASAASDARVMSPPLAPPEPEPEPLADTPEAHKPDPEPAPTRLRGTSFEDLFGRKLPIWAGGITLIVAAVLMVKYSIDSGLLSPLVRVVMGLVFGTGLIAGAELARRKAEAVADPRIAQALAGAGVGSLYAAVLAAANMYQLIAPGTAFVCLAAITALGMALSLRFGMATAVLALLGGLATPALVSTGNPNVPLLCGYLGVVIASLTVLSRKQRWFWLGACALLGGTGWTALLIVMGGMNQLGTLSAGLLILLIGLGLPLLSAGSEKGLMLRVIASLAAALQIAVLIQQGGYAPLTWGLYGLLSLGFAWLSWRTPALRAAIVVPLATGLILTWLWPEPALGLFSAVMIGIVAVFGGLALARLWRGEGTVLEAGQLAALGLAGNLICNWQFDHGLPGQSLHFAWLALGFAAVPGLGAWLTWSRGEQRQGPSVALLAMTSGVLVIMAMLIGLADWLAPVSIALVTAGLLALAERTGDRLLRRGTLVFLGAAVLTLIGTAVDSGELERLWEASVAESVPQALLRWAALAALAAAFCWRFAASRGAVVLQVLAAVLGYGLIAQLVPPQWLAIAAAAVAAGFAVLAARKPQAGLQPVVVTLSAIVALWALAPVAEWLLAAMVSLLGDGDPVLVTDLPELRDVVQRLLVPAGLVLAALWQLPAAMPPALRRIVAAGAAVLALIGLHVVYKQLFHISDSAAFVHSGLAERTLWEALLAGGAILAARLGARRDLALIPLLAALAHNVVYTLLIHNPLWSEQAVGALPIANLLLPSFGLVIAAPLLVAQIMPQLGGRWARAMRLAQIVVIVLLAYASLRQLFHGTILTAPGVTSVENILRSVLAVAQAIGMLIWGIRKGQREWRIASLVLMLGAVGKVFLFDASGLEGLLRIASFLALGFSLIGLGWLYSRYLKPTAEE